MPLDMATVLPVTYVDTVLRPKPWGNKPAPAVGTPLWIAHCRSRGSVLAAAPSDYSESLFADPRALPAFVGDEVLTLTAKYPATPVASGPVSAPPRAAGPLPADGPGLAKTNGKAHAAVPFTWAFDYDVPNLIARLRSAWGASINVLGRCYFWTPRGLGIRE